MTDGRHLAVCRTLEQLRDAIAAYCEQHEITRQVLDRRAGLADGHSGKLLSPTSVKKFGSTSLRWVLAALDLEIVLRVREAPGPHGPPDDAHVAAYERKPHPKDWRRNRGERWGKRMAARRALVLSDNERSDIARRAAQARWQRRKEALQSPEQPEDDQRGAEREHERLRQK
jgi:hypothetical protein